MQVMYLYNAIGKVIDNDKLVGFMCYDGITGGVVLIYESGFLFQLICNKEIDIKPTSLNNYGYRILNGNIGKLVEVGVEQLNNKEGSRFMYYVMKRIVDKGRTWGFMCINTHNRQIVYLDIEHIKVLIDSNNIDITYSSNKRGFSFKGENKKINKIGSIEKNKIARYKENKAGNIEDDIKKLNKRRIKEIAGVGIDRLRISKQVILTGQSLVEYLEYKQPRGEWTSKTRILRRFLDSENIYEHKCMIITGMKRTGKTVLISQGIRYLLEKGISSEDIVLIQYSSDNSIMSDEKDRLIQFMNESTSKYIFVDEVTLLENFVSISKAITDMVCSLNKKVIVSGSDTLAFTMAEQKYLLHRCYMISTTMTEYKDWCNIVKRVDNKVSLDVADKQKLILGYMKDCTLNNYEYYANNETMYGYLLDAIALNILNSLNKNMDTIKKGVIPIAAQGKGLVNTDINLINKMFYLICYDVIHDTVEDVLGRNTDKDKHTVKRVIRLNGSLGSIIKNLTGVREENKEVLKHIQNQVLSKLYVQNGNEMMTIPEYKMILGMMEYIGLLVKNFRYVDSSSIRNRMEHIDYYLSVPSIYYRMIDTMFREVINIYKIDIDKEKLIEYKKQALGDVLESMIITQLISYINKGKCSAVDVIYKYRIDDMKEVDIMSREEEEYGIHGFAYDVKMSNKIAQKHFKAFDDEFKSSFASIVKTGNIGIIYMGETTTYKGYKAINAHDFLMDIGKYI